MRFYRCTEGAAGEQLIFAQPLITAVPAAAAPGWPRFGRKPARGLRFRQAEGRRAAVRLWLWAALIVWMGSPLQLFLSGVDPSAPAAAQAATPLYRYAHYLCVLPPLLVMATRSRATLRLARAAWPLAVFLVYAMASWLWSEDREASFQALTAGVPAVITAAGLAVALQPGRLAQVLLLALAFCALGSLAAALCLPHFGVAGAQDAVGASPAGEWRGLYLHKNILGHIAGLAVGALATRGGRQIRPAPLRWAALIAAMICVAASRSASGLTLAIGLPLIDQVLLRPRGLARWAIGGFAVAALAAAFAERKLILSAGLDALGRDATLSGRTVLWRAAVALAPHHALAGWGLNYSVSPAMAAQLTGLFGVNHVHNALLDVFINLGLLGVGALGAATLIALRIGAQPSASASGATRATLSLIALGWLLSGLTEDMAVRGDGPMAQFGLCALAGLYSLRAGQGAFRRPVFRFRLARGAPFRPPRLA